ncbi:MAG: response regulator [Planctomycetota bacterium]|nr:response regulator [Planctomycetota bacterium]
MRVMLVDDSRTMRTVERDILKSLGLEEIEEACDVHDALSKITAFQPDLMLVDWDLPELDGLELVRRVRERGESIPIILITERTERSRILEAIHEGVNNVVAKPFTAEVMIKRIQDTMTRAA